MIGITETINRVVIEILRSMAATSRGLVASSALQGRFIANLNRSRSSRWSSSTGTRGFVMPTSKSFRAFRTIKKSPRLNRSSPRVFSRMGAMPSAMLGDNYFMAKKEPQQDDVMRTFANDDDAGVAVDENDPTPAVVDSVNAVLADIVDGQKYLKETGRTKARPMKRRALVVSLALGALRDPLDSVDSRLGSLRRTSSTARLTRTPSASGFARTAQLISQLSFGSPHGNDMH